RLTYEEVARRGTPEAYRDFIRDHPDSPYLPQARAQLQLYDLRLPVRLANAWGFINGRGELVIPPAFEKVGPFAEGFARVRQNGRWGYINDRGKVVIGATFDGARDFSEGLAVVLTRSPKRTKKPLYQAFYIDTTGRPAFDKSYETDGLRMPIHPFSDGLGAVIDPRTGKLGYVDRQGNYVVAPLFTAVPGPPGAPAQYAFSGFSNGFAWVKDGVEEGLIDQKGVFLVHGKYAQPTPDTLPVSRYRHSFGNGLCPVQDRTNGQTFYVDTTGKKAIVLPAGAVGLPFRDGVAWVKLPVAGQYQLIDKAGTVLTDVYAAQVRPFAEGLAVVQREAPTKRVFFYDEVPEGSYVYLDKKGNQPFDAKFHVLTEPEYSFLNGDFNGGIAGVLLEGRQTYIDRVGKVVWQSKETW
ncbi:MAG TPA: WG repeat-containing protein, partial [Cytophagales bacterium]